MTDSRRMWQEWGSDAFATVWHGRETLEPGIYTIEENATVGILFRKSKQCGDRVYNLPGLPNQLIIDQINAFWEAEDTYRKYNFVHKRGILLYGPPGNGKTCVISALIDHLIKEKHGVVLCVGEFGLASRALTILKRVEPELKVMTLMEDLDTLLSGEYKSEEPYALSMLDGQGQVNGVVHVATTNYPEQLADRFIRRPGRFDLVIGIAMPVKETRRSYFQQMLGVDHPEIETLTEKTEGLSLAYLREIASSFLCLHVPIEESVKRLKKNFSSPIKIEDHSTLGFKIGYDDAT